VRGIQAPRDLEADLDRLAQAVADERGRFLDQALGVAWRVDPAVVRFTNPDVDTVPEPVEQLLLNWQDVDSAEAGWARSDGVFGVPADTGLNLPWTAAGALDAAEEVTDTGSMDRRVFVHLTGGALTTPAHE
jgi:hypothetical protein